MGSALAGTTLGVLGLGRIGSRVTLTAVNGFGMTVIAHDPYISREECSLPVTFRDTLAELLPEADFITLHVPLTPEERKSTRLNSRHTSTTYAAVCLKKKNRIDTGSSQGRKRVLTR